MNYIMISREQMRKVYYEDSGSNVKKYMIITAVEGPALSMNSCARRSFINP